jgi:arginine/lysine/ornithine decarboxylase
MASLIKAPWPDDWTFAEGTRLLRGAFQLDHSTSVGELGSLFVPTGDQPVQRLKRRLADAYGVAWSFPSTHGTTGLNILSLLSACRPQGRVLLSRDAHSSVIAAMVHGGFEPVYVVPIYDARLGVSLGPTVAAFREMLDREAIDCVCLTSPNYFGIVGELGEIVALAHERGLPVVVDAAHAPHFHFCHGLPIAAEDVGADYVTQSTHKVATALSQGSLLLLNDASRIESLYEQVNELGLVSTSFSYPILASVELGVRQLVHEGERIWSRTIDRAESFRSACRTLPGVACFGRDEAAQPGFRDLDVTRVTIDVRKTGLTGFEVARKLGRHGIYPEMATLQHVLFLLTPGTSDQDLEQLLGALKETVQHDATCRPVTVVPPPPLPERACSPRVARFSPKRVVPVGTSVGSISGETIATYPPGVPIITAGERVSAEAIEYLRHMRHHGSVLKGASDPHFDTIKVL